MLKMISIKIEFSLSILIILFLSKNLYSQEIVTVNFDTLPNGSPVIDSTLIDDDYSSMGVIFSSNVSDGPTAHTSNNFSISKPNILCLGPENSFYDYGILTAKFVDPQSGDPTITDWVHLRVPALYLTCDASGKLRLKAFNRDSNLITESGLNISMNCPALFCHAWALFLEIDTIGISYVTFEILDAQNFYVAVDDFSFKYSQYNYPPEIISPSFVTAYEDSSFEYTASAIDPEDSTITYDFQSYPSWLLPNDSIISGIPGEGAVDTSFVVVASDGESTDTLFVEVTVISVNDPPKLISPNVVTAYEDSLFKYTASAKDPEDSLINYTFQNYPNWLTPEDSTISGIPPDGTLDTLFIVIASDGELTDSLFVTVNVIPINDPPHIINISDFIITNDKQYIIYLDTCVIDADHNPDLMIWEITTSNENLTVNIVNRVAIFNVSNWSGETEVFFKVTDPENGSDSIKVKCSTLPTSVESINRLIPGKFLLKQNYPNPFYEETSIQYHLPEPSTVTLTIYNLAGKHITTLVNDQQKAGIYSVKWNGKTESDKPVPSGIYIYRLETSSFNQVKKLLFIK
jgi:hypothetical protein